MRLQHYVTEFILRIQYKILLASGRNCENQITDFFIGKSINHIQQTRTVGLLCEILINTMNTDDKHDRNGICDVNLLPA